MIPAPETVTAAWLSEQLNGAGLDVSIRGFDAERVGTGQIGRCYRYTLDYESAPPDAPSTLIGKFPSDDPLSQQTGVMLRNYYREVRFYQLLAERLPIRTPRCYAAEIEGEGPVFVLLLEDMAPATQGDQLAGCSADVARSAVLELVGLQAPSWNDESLKAHDWLYVPPEAQPMDIAELYRQTLPGFIDRYGAHLEADQVAIIERVAEAPDGPLFAPLDVPFCLEHVDYRLDNMLITDGDPPRVAVVDWQSLKLGRPLSDVAYFLGAGLLPDVRRSAEEEIVRAYHRGLLDAGIEEFDWAACWEAYRRATFAGFGVTVVASMIVEQTERGDRMFTVMADRHSRHALDLGAEEFLI